MFSAKFADRNREHEVKHADLEGTIDALKNELDMKEIEEVTGVVSFG
jgi:hypothetical protein